MFGLRVQRTAAPKGVCGGVDENVKGESLRKPHYVRKVPSARSTIAICRSCESVEDEEVERFLLEYLDSENGGASVSRKDVLVGFAT